VGPEAKRYKYKHVMWKIVFLDQSGRVKEIAQMLRGSKANGCCGEAWRAVIERVGINHETS